MIWHVKQNVVKCLMIPLSRFCYIYNDLFTLSYIGNCIAKKIISKPN